MLLQTLANPPNKVNKQKKNKKQKKEVNVQHPGGGGDPAPRQ